MPRPRSARWSIRINGKAKGGKEQFYGHKMHSVCDAHYGIPPEHTIRPANANDSPQLPAVFCKVRAAHPGLRMRYAWADCGYNAIDQLPLSGQARHPAEYPAAEHKPRWHLYRRWPAPMPGRYAGAGAGQGTNRDTSDADTNAVRPPTAAGPIAAAGLKPPPL